MNEREWEQRFDRLHAAAARVFDDVAEANPRNWTQNEWDLAEELGIELHRTPETGARRSFKWLREGASE